MIGHSSSSPSPSNMLTTINNKLLFAFFTFLVAVVGGGLALPCPEDYSPCTCVLYGDGTISVDCDRVPVAQVRAAFNRTTRRDLYRFDWALLTPDDPVPADVLSGKRAGIMRIAGGSPFTPLVVDRNALGSSGDFTTDLIFADFELSRTDFAFLEGFRVLLTLSISTSSGIASLSTLPTLPGLKELSVFDCSGFESLQSVPGLASVQLENLRLNSNQLSDAAVKVVLDSIDPSSLARLSLNDNLLTKVPERIPSMPGLERIFLSGNIIPVLPSGSLAFQAQQKILEIYLPKVSLSSVQIGAFEGDFSQAQVALDENQLDRLDSEVFLPMLDQMIQTALGNLYLFYNPIDCSGCGLAWLIRDRRTLLFVIRGGTCSNGTTFDQLLPSGYNGCP